MRLVALLLALLSSSIALAGPGGFAIIAASARPFARDVPDLFKTPGSTRPISFVAICATKWGRDARHVTAAMRHAVFASYGLSGRDDPACGAEGCEVDHLIPRELGGADEVQNLWPQPIAGSPWNARLKDRLENRLRRDVCSGKIGLREARLALVGDWRVAYLKYYGVAP